MSSSPTPDPDPNRFNAEVAGIVRRTPAGHHQVVFLGSSTFTLWSTLDADLGHIGAVNHGFGGSQLSDCIHFANQLVFPYTPRAIVLYGGDNDLANGKSVERVIADFGRFRTLVTQRLPEAVLYWVSIKVSVARWNQLREQTAVNDYVQAETTRDPRLRFIDIRPVMLNGGGPPSARYFLEDGLHLSPTGYATWATVFRPRLQQDLAPA